jgi:hypothetical protein
MAATYEAIAQGPKRSNALHASRCFIERENGFLEP